VLHHPASADVAPEPPTPLPALDEADAPDDLDLDERLIWLRLAPYAMANGTLIDATLEDFKRLCRNLWLERRYAKSVTDQGSANHRGMIQRCDLGLARFGLAGLGVNTKGSGVASVTPAVDPREAKFFGGSGSRA
jgi:hypothetical protein